MANEWLTAADVARIANVTPATARVWADKGLLRVKRTASGIRLYSRKQVEDWARARRDSGVGGHRNE